MALTVKKTALKAARSYRENQLYEYNADTCRYERSAFSVLDWCLYAGGVLLTASAILVVLLIVNDALVNSDAEKRFRKENAALSMSISTVSRKLADLDATLAALGRKDKELHTKFFGQHDDALARKQQVTNATPDDVRAWLSSVEDKSAELLSLARASTREMSETEMINDPRILSKLPLNLPVRDLSASDLLSGFGMRINPYHKGLYHHPGVDIAMPRGTQVISTAPGTIITARLSSLRAGYGNYIEIDHGNGFITRYAHLENLLVRKGDKVEAGAPIATTGNSGSSVAPHLHYEIVRDGLNVDPVLYMIRRINAETHTAFMDASRKHNQSLD